MAIPNRTESNAVDNATEWLAKTPSEKLYYQLSTLFFTSGIEDPRRFVEALQKACASVRGENPEPGKLIGRIAEALLTHCDPKRVG